MSQPRSIDDAISTHSSTGALPAGGGRPGICGRPPRVGFGVRANRRRRYPLPKIAFGG